MSKVKFIQLGEKEKLIKNGSDGTYDVAIKEALDNYPGAIIFATYYETAGGEKQQEIYANGVKYSVGGGGGGTVYVGTVQIGSDGQFVKNSEGSYTGNVYKGYTGTNDSEITSLSTATFKDGDIYVLSKSLNGTTWDSLTSTGYVRNKSRWEALAGSVNAANVWFTTKITRAGNYSAIGNISRTEGEELVGDNGTTLQELITRMFTKKIDPEPSGPNYSFTVSLAAPNITVSPSGTQEVGTKITLSDITANNSSCSETITVSGLDFGYLDPDDVKQTGDYKRTQTGHTTSGQYKLTLSSTGFVDQNGTAITFNSTTENNQLKIKGKTFYVTKGDNTLTLNETGLTYTPKGFTPTVIKALDNLGNVSSTITVSQAVGDNKDTSASTTKKITGYYPYLYGAFSNNSLNFNSDNLITLTHSSTKPTSISVSAGTRAIVVAIPEATSGAFASIKNSKNDAPYTGSDSMGTKSVTVNFSGNQSCSYRVLYAYTAAAASGASTYNISYSK